MGKGASRMKAALITKKQGDKVGYFLDLPKRRRAAMSGKRNAADWPRKPRTGWPDARSARGTELEAKLAILVPMAFGGDPLTGADRCQGTDHADQVAAPSPSP